MNTLYTLSVSSIHYSWQILLVNDIKWYRRTRFGSNKWSEWEYGSRPSDLHNYSFIHNLTDDEVTEMLLPDLL